MRESQDAEQGQEEVSTEEGCPKIREEEVTEHNAGYRDAKAHVETLLYGPDRVSKDYLDGWQKAISEYVIAGVECIEKERKEEVTCPNPDR